MKKTKFLSTNITWAQLQDTSHNQSRKYRGPKMYEKYILLTIKTHGIYSKIRDIHKQTANTFTKNLKISSLISVRSTNAIYQSD